MRVDRFCDAYAERPGTQLDLLRQVHAAIIAGIALFLFECAAEPAGAELE
jgi:hypothetical protein